MPFSVFLATWIGLIGFIGLTGCVRDHEPKGADLQVGDPLPQFEVIMSDGERISTESLKGKTAVITFFNTDCSDCRRELPELQAAYDEYASNPDMTFVLIAREEEESSIEAYWTDAGLTMPYSPQPDRRVYNLFATTGIPRTYIASPAGIILRIYYTP